MTCGGGDCDTVVFVGVLLVVVGDVVDSGVCVIGVGGGGCRLNLLLHLICSLCRSDCSRGMVSGDGGGGGVIVGGCGCGVVGDCGFDLAE